MQIFSHCVAYVECVLRKGENRTLCCLVFKEKRKQKNDQQERVREISAINVIDSVIKGWMMINQPLNQLITESLPWFHCDSLNTFPDDFLCPVI